MKGTETGGLMTISDWRKKIDEIDTVLLQLLNLRTEFAVEVARLKEEEGLSLCAPEREQKVIGGMKNLNDGPLDGEAVTRIFRAIMDESRRIQEIHAGEGSTGERGSNTKQPERSPSKLRTSRRYGTAVEP
jgi:chorismate mutase-like protein